MSMSWVRSLGRMLEANPRLRWLLSAILGLLLLYGLLELRDQVVRLDQKYAQQARRLAATRRLAGEEFWIQRAQEAGEKVAAMEARLWRAETPGLAEARLADWVKSLLQSAGATRIRVEANLVPPSDASALPEGVREVRAEVHFRHTPSVLLEVLRRVAEQQRMLSVDKLWLRDRPFPQAEVSIRAWFLVEEEQ